MEHCGASFRTSATVRYRSGVFVLFNSEHNLHNNGPYHLQKLNNGVEHVNTNFYRSLNCYEIVTMRNVISSLQVLPQNRVPHFISDLCIFSEFFYFSQSNWIVCAVGIYFLLFCSSICKNLIFTIAFFHSSDTKE